MQILIFVICFSLLCACSNPLGGGGSTSSPDHAPFLLETGDPFAVDFDFNNATFFAGQSGTEIAGGTGRLLISDSIDDSSLTSGTDLNFAHFASHDANIAIVSDKVVMTTGTPAVFTSRIINGQNSVADWSHFYFKSSLPFGKEIALAAETGYGSGVTDFSNGLLGLWHLNEVTADTVTATADFRDVTASANHATSLGTGWTMGSDSLFGKGVTRPLFSLTSNVALTSTQNFTYAIWVNMQSFTNGATTDGAGTYLVDRVLSGAGNPLTSMKAVAGNYTAQYRCSNASNLGALTGGAIQLNVWQHVVFVRERTASLFRIYVNGVAGTTGADTGCAINLDKFKFGGHNDVAVTGMNGIMDEVAIWGRALSPAEIGELYRRGSNRLKFQIRTCTDANCSTNPAFVGYDGTSSSYITEANNNSNPGTFLGTVSLAPMALSLNTLAGTQSGFNTWYQAQKANRYIQYKTILESQANNFPDLTSVRFDPQSRYSVSNPAVYNLSTSSVGFKKLTGVVITEGICGGAIHYDIGNASSQYLTWNGTDWAISTDYASAKTKTILEGLTAEDWAKFPQGSGALYVRAFLPSDGVIACAINQISVSGTR